MDFPLSYCPGGWQRLKRPRGFYAERPQDQVSARMEVPTQALKKFAERYPPGYTPCPDLNERVAFWDELMSERAAIEDDSIPSVYLSALDQGLYGGIVGSKVQFMAHPETGWISSMVPPTLEAWSGLDKMRIDRTPCISALPWPARSAF